MRIRKWEPDRPSGYPYLLWKIKKGKKQYYTLGVSEEQAVANAGLYIGKRDRIEPTGVFLETDMKGHANTHALFESFGDNWMCKNGYVFFPKFQKNLVVVK
jgi:hypothetical protein